MIEYYKPSELILNDDQSIYHLNLRSENIGDTIILVGDPDRVGRVSRHFDYVDFKTQKREFVTHTGWIEKKRITVISTGIGTDNIDIVLNELDALVNIDFETRQRKETFKQLKFIRIGTSGSLQEDIPVNSFLVSSFGLGLEGLLHTYDYENIEIEKQLLQAFDSHQVVESVIKPYIFSASTLLLSNIPKDFQEGITATCGGFYAAQGRYLRARGRNLDFIDNLKNFKFKKHRITNLEMETAGIYGLASVLGHEAISFNAILANRTHLTFSKTPKKTIDQLITKTLEWL